jgi:hypothetical protein
VDNGPPLDPPLTTRLPKGAQVIVSPRNAGYTGGCNLAFDHCRREYPESAYCLVASHDLQVEPGTLHHLLLAAESHPRFGVLAPVLTAPRASWGGSWDGERPHNHRSGPVELVERDWASGTCLLVRVECATAIGGFDEAFGSYVEDVDFCLRARAAGWGVAVLGGAKAAGLGTASRRAGTLQEANIILLCAKLGGARAGRAAWLRLLRQSGFRLAKRLGFLRGIPDGPSLQSSVAGCLLAARRALFRATPPAPANAD